MLPWSKKINKWNGMIIKCYLAPQLAKLARFVIILSFHSFTDGPLTFV